MRRQRFTRPAERDRQPERLASQPETPDALGVTVSTKPPHNMEVAMEPNGRPWCATANQVTNTPTASPTQGPASIRSRGTRPHNRHRPHGRFPWASAG
jgi:hypothetical protein